LTVVPTIDDYVAFASDTDERSCEPSPETDGRIPQGNRNAALASLAGTMRRGGMGAEAITAALLLENHERCDPPLPVSEVQKIARSIARYAPSPQRYATTRTEAGQPTEAQQHDERPRPVDVVELAKHAPERPEDDAIIADLLYVGQILVVTGEEGDGKTTLAEQAIRQLVRGERVWDFFEPGPVSVERALFVDTEMEEPEVRRRCADLDSRGLEVPAERFYWLCAGGLNLGASEEDRAYVRDAVASTGGRLLWIDAGGGAVDDPKEDVDVRGLFDFLSQLLRSGLLACGITLHPRKRGQGEYGRRFDDLFGSREWKGRVSKALYLDETSITAWKDRGAGLRRRWPPEPGSRYARATIERPGIGDPSAMPFVIRYDPGAAAEDRATIRGKVLDLVSERPGELTKTGVADRLGGRKGDVLSVVGELLGDGTLGPDKRGARLSIQTSTDATLALNDEDGEDS
jgi:hypothetical protein